MKRNLTGIFAIAMIFVILFAFPVSAEDTTNTTDTTQAAVTGGLIAITFDDGPSTHTEKLLDGLKQREAKVTFFIVGNRLSEYEDLLIRAYKEGHEIASHTWDHSDLTKLTSTEIAENLQKTEDEVYKILGFNIGPLNVRPPKGMVDEKVESSVDVPLILWNVDTADWNVRNAEAVKNHIIDHAQDGAIILLHDLYGTSVDGALAAIDELEQQGYTFVTVNELFRRKGQELLPGVTYTNANSDGIDLGPLPDSVSAQPIVDEENNENDKDDKKNDKKDKSDTEDDRFPVALLVFCIMILLVYGAGMLHTFGIITLPIPLEQRRPEQKQRKRRR